MNRFIAPKVDSTTVLITYPFSLGSRLLMTKLLSGCVFGKDCLVRLQIAICTEMGRAEDAERLKIELEMCGFRFLHAIDIVDLRVEGHEVPDYIIFTTPLTNPNKMKCLCEVDALCDLHLIGDLKMTACSLQRSVVSGMTDKKPVIIADGLISLRILNKMCDKFDRDLMYCPTPLTVIAKSVLGEFIKVNPNMLNDIHIWGADDSSFYMEVEKPIVVEERAKIVNVPPVTLDREYFESRKLDITKFNDLWLKTEYISKTSYLAECNPYGEISEAFRIAEALKTVWEGRGRGNKKIYGNLGVIAGIGSRENCPGVPMILPVVISNGKWEENTDYADNPVVQLQRRKFLDFAWRNSETQIEPDCL